ncbi:hypothetical protein [Hominifimenecus sp. rT4P-3]|uniref:hypothetical protein n=1 Tax=Hominifimenecus sp. rT4P-3 TaxID=3242979 RepID=UPI003DA48C40
MAENRRTPKLVDEISAGPCLFAWEEYWEEDDAGFCCVDYVLEKHTRLVALDANTRQQLFAYPFDGKEYPKNLEYKNQRVVAAFHQSWDRKTLVTIDPNTLQILSEVTEEDT